MAKITYANKVALNENPEIALINKVTDDDLNEIKSVVNTNDDNVGDLTNLNTTNKTNIVAAVNEINSNAASAIDLGDISDLTTTDKTSAVNAINELNSNKAANDIVVVSSSDPTGNNWKLYIDSGEATDNAYYNDNGTKTSLKTTTFDTLPVGTEVNYTGSVVPDGWSEIQDYDTGWVDMSSYINTTNFSARSGQPPMARRIGNVVYWKGAIYCSTALNDTTGTLMTGIPAQFLPTGEINTCGVTWYIGEVYHIYIDNTGVVRVSETSNIGVQNNWAGFTLANISGYLVD